MIKVTPIKPQLIEHFDPNNISLGMLNEYENGDLRAQIAEHKAIGYYLMFNGEKISIEPTGKINDWPNGMYDLIMDQLARIFKASR
jgi:predicted ATPase